MADFIYGPYTIASTPDLTTIALNIQNGGLPLPSGMEGSGNLVWAIFGSALSGADQTSLAALMAAASTNQIPTTVNSIFTFDDLIDNRAAFNTALAAFGLSCTAWISRNDPYQCKIIFNKVLSNQDKNNIRTVLLQMWKQTQ